MILIALCLGIYLIATTVVIAKDGVIFIEYSKKLEVSPSQAMQEEYQHPGYPAFILVMSKIVGLFCKGQPVFSMIYSAQMTSLLFRILTIIVLYILGRDLVGAKLSFWSIFILALLPKPAEYGSDALSDWPHMFFLATGMLLLLRGAANGKWWIFALAGIAGGLAYLVRPEGAQIIIYGIWWLGLQLLWKKRTLSKSRAAIGLASMIFIFLLIASPYMKLKGAIFPKKSFDIFSSSFDNIEKNQQFSMTDFHAGIVPSKIAGAFVKIFENIGDTLMWFFLVPYLIGIFLFFKKKKFLEREQFFIIALVILNIPLMVWLYCSHDYMSGRHTLPIVVFTIFLIPTGLNHWASILNMKYSRGYQHTHRWFAILMTIGIAVCSPKLFTPLHSDKIAFRNAAQWFAQNTETSAVLAVPDYRISFYAERQSIKVLDENIPDIAEYFIEFLSEEDDEQEFKQQQFQKVYSSESIDENKFVIYRRLNP